MSKLNIDMIREIKNNHPAVPEPFLNESKLLDVEEDCGKHFFLPEPADSVPLAGLFTVLLRLRPAISSPHISWQSIPRTSARRMSCFGSIRLREKGRFCYIAIRTHSCLRRCRSPAIRSQSNPHVSSARMSC